MDGFYDEKTASVEIDWHPRLEPYAATVQSLLGPEPIGLALNKINERYNNLNGTLNRLQNRLGKGQSVVPAELASTMLQANDAKNFLLFGDPATYISLEWA